MTNTPLDLAHSKMDDGGDTARLQFFERLADAELYLLLDAEPDGDQVTPATFETEDGTFVLGFDLEERLTEFVDGAASFAAMSGRNLCAMLAGAEIGIALNPGDFPSSMLIPPNAIKWLQATLSNEALETQERPIRLDPPRDIPEILLTALDSKLAMASGLARFAYLTAATYAPDRPSHLLAIVDPAPGAETALTQAVTEALTFSGIDAGQLDVAFFAASDPLAATLAKVGLRFDIPQPQPSLRPQIPGSDPDRPPKLR